MKTTFVTALLFLCSTSYLQAQMVGSDVFLKGDYVETGIATNGSYGSGSNAPSSYHSRPDFGITSGPLGFVADPDKDGWLVSSPGRVDYYGDFFMPGTPQEGWDIEINGTRARAWRGSGATSMTGGLTGSNTGYTSTGTQFIGVWEGSLGNLDIKQTTTQKKDKVYFVTTIELTNTGSTTLTNIYYNRSLDPEPDATIGGNYASDKRIIYQPNAISRNCLVKATGQDYKDAYVGLGSKDCRAKCYITNTYTPDAQLSSIYAQNSSASSYIFNVGGSSSANTSMGIVFNVGSLPPGETAELAYAYILKQADLDSALNETAPSFLSGTVEYKPFTTLRVCPGTTIPLKVKGGKSYKWIWTPGTSLSADSMISSGSLPPYGGAYGDSVSILVDAPRTYTAVGVSICDTQTLVFYTDTISFAIPPFVTTPIKYCQGATATALTAAPASGATVWWSTSIGGTETLTPPTPSTATPGTTRYFVRQQNAAGCYSQYTHIDVIVIAKPEPPEVTSLVYCYGAKTTQVSAKGENIKWYTAATGGTIISIPPTPSSTTPTVSNFYPSQTVNGCESDRANLEVKVAQVKADFTILKDSLCGEEDMVLTNGSTYELGGVPGVFKSLWSFGDGDTSMKFDPTHSYKKQGSYLVKLVALDDNKCADSIIKSVYVAPDAKVDFVRSDTLICQGETIDFTASLTPGYYKTEWNFGDGGLLNYNVTKIRQAFKIGGNFNVNFKAYYSICGIKDISYPISVTEIPKVNLGQDETLCPGSSVITLKNSTTLSPNIHYLWSTGDTSDKINIYHEGQYWLKIFERTCSAADSITIIKGCHLEVPNAFNPTDLNPNNHNFLPRPLLGESIATFEMKIWDRWGQLLFESTLPNGTGWDGTYKGEQMPMGVYVYKIKVSFSNGIIENYNGNVSLVR